VTIIDAAKTVTMVSYNRRLTRKFSCGKQFFCFHRFSFKTIIQRILTKENRDYGGMRREDYSVEEMVPSH
jgi:hypothetical protein